MSPMALGFLLQSCILLPFAKILIGMEWQRSIFMVSVIFALELFLANIDLKNQLGILVIIFSFGKLLKL